MLKVLTEKAHNLQNDQQSSICWLTGSLSDSCSIHISKRQNVKKIIWCVKLFLENKYYALPRQSLRHKVTTVDYSLLSQHDRQRLACYCQQKANIRIGLTITLYFTSVRCINNGNYSVTIEWNGYGWDLQKGHRMR